jgi:hypothetical protein
VSVTSDTIFSHTGTPLTIWFVVAWEMAAYSTGVSARTLYRMLGFGSYETAWAILHRYRRGISARGLELLDGVVEVDESYFGGEHKAGRPARPVPPAGPRRAPPSLAIVPVGRPWRR